MPDLKSDVIYIMSLYSRCRANNILPYAGGILDQPAWILDLFEVVDNVKSRFQKEKEQTDEAFEKLNGRHQP